MLPSLVILAQTAAPAAENGITRITHDFGISTPFLVAQIINFSVVAFLLWKLAFKPVLATLDERQKKIASGLQYAEEMKARLEQAARENAETARHAQAEATKVIDEARKAAKELFEKQSQESSAKAAEILAKAQQAIELEKAKMLAEAKREIAHLVIATTERVLAQQLSDADRSRYNESAAKELAQA